MRYFWNTLFKGLIAVLPVGLTIYLIYWLAFATENMLGPVIAFFIPDAWYWPGMGLLAGLMLFFVIGLVVNAWLVQRALQLGEQILERIPFVKSVYSALNDFASLFSSSDTRKELQQVVLVTVGRMRLIGFITAQNVRDLPVISTTGTTDADESIVAVYLPMSYQIGGYTIYVPRSRLQVLNIPMEDAMRRVLTAGVAKKAERKINVS